MENATEVDNLEQDKSNHGGLRAGAGRPRGATNKIPRVAKENIIRAFEDLGGIEGLVNWAKSDSQMVSHLRWWYLGRSRRSKTSSNPLQT